MIVVDELTLDCLGKTFGLLLGDIELPSISIFLDAETGITDSIDITRYSAHDEVVEMIVKRSALFLQSFVDFDYYLVPIAAW